VPEHNKEKKKNKERKDKEKKDGRAVGSRDFCFE
jgi:hypothetical protein